MTVGILSFGSLLDDPGPELAGRWRARILGEQLERHPDVQWLEPEDDVIERWLALVDASLR